LPVYDVPGHGKVKGTPETIREKYGVEVTEKEIGKPPSAPARGRAEYTQVVTKPGAFRTEPTPEPVKEEPLPPTPPGKETFTLPEYKQHTYSEYMRGQEIYSGTFTTEERIKQQIKDVDPKAKYRIPMIEGRYVSQEELDTYLATKPPGWIPQYQIVTGVELRGMLQEDISRIKEYRIEAEPQLAETWRHFKETERWPSETKIIRKGERFETQLPDTRLEWSKGEFKKIEKAYGLHPLLGATAEFGFGAVSSIAAFGKPIAERVAGKPLPHYLSPLDIAFEPLGWSPPGSAELIGKRPITMAGGIWGETLQLTGFHYTIKGFTTGAKIGTKAIVKNIPKAYGQFTKVFPEEKIVTGLGKKVTTTQFGKTIYRWGAKGYVPGKQFIQVGTKEIRGPVKGLTYKETLFKPEKGRIWLSPKDVAKFQRQLAVSKTLDIGFPTARTIAGVGKAEMVVDITAFKVGFRKVIKTYGFALGKRQIGVKVPAYGYRLIPIVTREAGVQPTRASWLQFGRSVYGVPKQPYLRTIGPGFIVEKPWHKYVLKSAFKTPTKTIRDVGAYQTLIYKPPTLIFKPRAFPFKAPTTSHLMRITVPVKPLAVSPLALPVLGVRGIKISMPDIDILFKQALTPEYALTQETLSMQKLEKITESALKVKQITKPSLATVQTGALISESVELPALEQAQAQVQLQALEQKLMLQLKTPLMQSMRYKTPKQAQRLTSKLKFPFLFPLLPTGKEKRVVEKPGQGYKLLIKERQYFRGKPRGQPTFKIMPIHSLSHTDVHRLGQHLTDFSVGMAYTTKKTNVKPKPLKFSVPFGFGYKFYEKKGTFIEGRAFAIDTREEVEQLSAFRVLSDMRKREQVSFTEQEMFDFARLGRFGFGVKKGLREPTDEFDQLADFGKKISAEKSLVPTPTREQKKEWYRQRNEFRKELKYAQRIYKKGTPEQIEKLRQAKASLSQIIEQRERLKKGLPSTRIIGKTERTTFQYHKGIKAEVGRRRSALRYVEHSILSPTRRTAHKVKTHKRTSRPRYQTYKSPKRVKMHPIGSPMLTLLEPPVSHERVGVSYEKEVSKAFAFDSDKEINKMFRQMRRGF